MMMTRRMITIILFRSSLSSNSEGDDIEMCRYSRNGYNTASSVMSSTNMMATSPYIISRDTGQAMSQPGVKKDDKYWERRRWVPYKFSLWRSFNKNFSEKIILPPKSRVTLDESAKISCDCGCCALRMPIEFFGNKWIGRRSTWPN